MQTVVKKSDGGYFTIEAAFIGSITCFLMIAFWLIAVYLVDLGYVDSCLKEQAAILSLSKDDKSGAAAYTKEELEKRLIVASLEYFFVACRNEQVVGKARLSLSMPIPVVGEWLGETWTNSLTVTLEKGDYETKMRRWDQLE